jgi:hypothetical protein
MALAPLGRASFVIMLVEISPFAHSVTLLDPSTIAHRAHQTVWVEERYGRIAQLQTKRGEHLPAANAHWAINMHFDRLAR